MSVQSVLEYLNSLNENQRKYVQEFIDFMEREFPNVNQKISFSMPMWMVGKKMNEGYIAISAAKNHFSIHLSDEDFIQKLALKLTNCKSGKRCINIKYGDDKSFSVVKESIKIFLNR